MFLLSHFMTSWKTWMFINYPVLFLVSKNSCMSLKCTSCKTTFANFDTFSMTRGMWCNLTVICTFVGW